MNPSEITPSKGRPARQPIRVAVTPRSYAALEALAEEHDLPLGALARAAVEAGYEHVARELAAGRPLVGL